MDKSELNIKNSSHGLPTFADVFTLNPQSHVEGSGFTVRCSGQALRNEASKSDLELVREGLTSFQALTKKKEANKAMT